MWLSDFVSIVQDLQMEKVIEIEAPGLQSLQVPAQVQPSRLEEVTGELIQLIQRTNCFKEAEVQLRVKPAGHQKVLGAAVQYFSPLKMLPQMRITCKPKNKVYLSASQEIDRLGHTSTKLKGGIRNLTGRFDFLECEYEQYHFSSEKNVINLTYRLPNFRRHQETTFQYSSGYRSLCAQMGETFRSFFYSTGLKGTVLTLEHSDRLPSLAKGLDCNELVQKNYCCPTNKTSLKLSTFLHDSVARESVHSGASQELSCQVGLPLLSDSKFIRLDLNGRKFTDLYDLHSRYSSSGLRGLLKHSVLEQAYSASLLLGRPAPSDFLPELSPRGFFSPRYLNEAQVSGSYSLKLNVYDYPLISQAGLIFFLFSHSTGSIGFRRSLEAYTAGGYGISFDLTKSVRLELLGTLGGASLRGQQRPTAFQFRIGLHD